MSFSQSILLILPIFITIASGLTIPEQNFVPSGFQHQFSEFPAQFSRDFESPQLSQNSIPNPHFHHNTARQFHTNNEFPNQGIYSQGTIGSLPSGYGQTNRNVEQVRVVKDEQNTFNSHSTYQNRNVRVVQQTGAGYANAHPYHLNK